MSGNSWAPMSAQNAILVVDDDNDVRWLLTRYLFKHGFEIDTAVDGAAMREQFPKNLITSSFST